MKAKSLFYLSLSAFMIRALYFFQALASPLFIKPVLDQRYYDLCAQQLAGAGGQLIDGFRPLLYPLFLSFFYTLDLHSGILSALLFQLLMGVGMTVLVALISTQLFRNEKAGILSGIFFALSAPPLFFEGQLLITTLFSFLLLVLWGIILFALEAKQTKRSIFLWILAGVMLGLSAQARPNALTLVLFFPALALLRFWKTKQRATSFTPLLALLSLVSVQIMFGMVNKKYSGEFSMMTHAGGINFYLGNHQKADGMIPRQDRYAIYEGEYRDPIQIIAEEGYREGTGITGSISQKKVSTYWKQKTLDEIKKDPARWLQLMIKKSWIIFWNHEVPNNRSFQFTATQDTRLLQWLPVRWWLLLALFPWGIAHLLKNDRAEPILWIASFFLLFSGTIMLFFVNSRFRIPLWPGMAIIAGGGSIYLWSELKRKTLPRTPTILSALLIPISLINWFQIPPDLVENDLSMYASAYYDQGRYAEALTQIEQCLKIAKNNPGYHFIHGNILIKLGNNKAAIQAFLKAIEQNDSDPKFHNNLGIAFENISNFHQAELSYKNALNRRANYRTAQTNLMLLFIRTNQLKQAKDLLSLLLTENPKNPTLHCAKLMIHFKESGNTESLNTAKKINPELANQLSSQP